MAKGFTRASTFVALIAAFFMLGGAPDLHADALSGGDIRAAKEAIKAIEAEKWQQARRLASRIKDPLALKLVRWLTLTGRNNGATFPQISSFITEVPDWPGQTLLRRRAEEAITDSTPAKQVISWFKDHSPVSADGKFRLGAALLAAGEAEKGRAVLRDAWVNDNFSKRLEKDFYRRYRRLLTLEDHMKRLDRLSWKGRKWPTRRMLWKVKAGTRALGEARFQLRHRQGNVDKAISQVPDELKNDPGLVYERLRWRRRKGRDKAAIELLANQTDSTPYPDKWWNERQLLARRALAKGHISEAYLIVKNHHLKEGADFADAEWLAGWIALRFLDDRKIARKHFTTMYESVKYPMSRARGAYWAGRAAEAMVDAKAAAQWYRTAAVSPTTYHGQLAAERLDSEQRVILQPEPAINTDEVAKFSRQELARVARLLAAVDKQDLMRPFVMRLSAVVETPGWRSLTASLARTLGRPDLAISIAKKSMRDGDDLIQAGYPALIPPQAASALANAAIEAPLVLAIIRQESAFYTDAKSRAGALGLMQLMPYTANRVARKLKISYSRKRLNSDPDYNLRLGQSYLDTLLGDFNGSYILALSAYNAGPSRARRWLRKNGDPKDASVDAIDWIEMIPFSETRNYVQRVLENLQVYRRRLAETEVALSLEDDLKR